MSSSCRVRDVRWSALLELSGAAALGFALLCFAQPECAKAQTFAQFSDMGGGVGSRLTSLKTADAYGLPLFGSLSGGAAYADFTAGNVYQFVADPVWNRIVYAKEGDWIKTYTNVGWPGGILFRPMDVDVAADGWFFIADTAHMTAGSYRGVQRLILR